MGVLSGVKVVELAGLGPAPHAAMMLADMGASVLRVDRPTNVGKPNPSPNLYQVILRNRPNVAIDLRHPEGLKAVRKLCDDADIVLEGFRPGTIERLGLGPDVLLRSKPSLVIGRATGWGQEGPLSQRAGHDLNYIALTGALSCIGQEGGPPVPPLSLVGDFGGGATYLTIGVLSAYIHAQRTGQGQVVDAAMIDGVQSLMSNITGKVAAGEWDEARRGTNLLDGGCPHYGVYETSDKKYVTIGPLEPQFFTILLDKLGLSVDDFHPQHSKQHWSANKEKFAAIFRTKTREEWTLLLQESDACFAPVLTLSEAVTHPHNRARSAFVEVDGFPQPAPAPRFSLTPSKIESGVACAGQHTRTGLQEWGFDTEEITRLEALGAAVQANI